MSEPFVPKPPPEPSLRRELRAILTLYVILAVLPTVLGLLFGPR